MIRDRFISPQVQMLLVRMDTHPEEFVDKANTSSLWTKAKWQDILNEGYFNRLEKFLLKRKYRNLKRDATQKKIMTTLLYGEEQKEMDFEAISTIARATKPSVTITASDIDDNYIRF